MAWKYHHEPLEVFYDQWNDDYTLWSVPTPQHGHVRMVDQVTTFIRNATCPPPHLYASGSDGSGEDELCSDQFWLDLDLADHLTYMKLGFTEVLTRIDHRTPVSKGPPLMLINGLPPPHSTHRTICSVSSKCRKWEPHVGLATTGDHRAWSCLLIDWQ